ncbi:MAG TPA: hypothetical protein VJX67_26395 [Blastocatellia bacterium]|nr:hypothetical protein [Blastocatellia bacterium]
MMNFCERLDFRFFRSLLVLCTSLMLVYQPAARSATAAAVGQISTTGTAEINGVSAVTGGAVFSGDSINTERDSTASLSLTAGRQVILVEASSLGVARTGSEITGTLSHGEVAVLSPANSPLVIEAEGTRIVPGAAGSVYAVELNGNKLNVTASRGAVSVEAAGRTVEVAEGNTMEATLAPAQDGSGYGVTPGIKTHLGTVVIVIAIALAATTLALLVRDLNTSCKVVSPSALGKCQVTH